MDAHLRDLIGDRGVIYALGGGAGHLTRALCLAAHVSRALVLCSAGVQAATSAPPGATVLPVTGAADVTRALAELKSLDATLVVDTFAAGLACELTAEVRRGFRQTVLVRRYVRPGSYLGDGESARYDRVLLPYPPGASEWEGRVSGTSVGWLVRPIAVDERMKAEVVVIGRGAGRFLRPGVHAIDGPFTALPRARRYVALGAGYNLVYELRSLGVPFRAVPEERRYDDQHRRVGLLGVGTTAGPELERWIEEGA